MSESVLKVDVFLNHQVDPDLMQEVGKDFFEHFKDFGITRVFIIDDFLANGEAAMGASRLVDMAGATVASIGILIEKSFQNGRNRLLDRGFHVYSQARIARLGKGIIEFVEE